MALVAMAVVLGACAGTPTPPKASTLRPDTSSSAPSRSTSPAAPAAWTTFGGGPSRAALAPSGATPANPRRAWRTPLDGQVYAQPLVVGDRVVVATEDDTVAALDRATGSVLWRTRLGSPMPASALACAGNIDPSGITSTPVVDTTSATVFAVAFVEPGRHELVSLSLTDGHVRWRRPIALTGVDPLAEQQRGALALVDGRVLVPFGGLYGDCGRYRGMLVSLPATGTGPELTFTVPTARGGAVWAPGGAVVDAQGRVLVATGNGASTTSFDGGNAVYALSPTMTPVDHFAPADWGSLSAADLDLGSTSPTLVGDRLVLQVGKSGVAYVLDATHLGGIGGELGSTKVCSGQAVGGTAVDGDLVVVACTGGLTGVRVPPDGTPRVVWRSARFTPGPPVIGGGRVWAVTRGGRLVGLDEATGRSLVSLPVPTGETSFPAVAVAGGIMVATAGQAVVALADPGS